MPVSRAGGRIQIAHLRKTCPRGMLRAEKAAHKRYKLKGEKNMELTYTMRGDYLLPDLSVPELPEITLGKYARMRRSYLETHRKALFTTLLTSGKLTAHLAEIEQAAQRRAEQIVTELAKAEGVTEKLKARDPMKWIGLMNNFRQSAEEIIRAELIQS